MMRAIMSHNFFDRESSISDRQTSNMALFRIFDNTINKKKALQYQRAPGWLVYEEGPVLVRCAGAAHAAGQLEDVHALHHHGIL